MIFAIAMMNLDRIHACLSQIYEPEIVPGIFERIQTMMNGYRDRRPRRDRTSLTQRDVILITYPDQVRDPSAPPLASLARFGERYLEGLINGIHLLPFYPSSSDDGFSVIDYHAVDAEYGSWEDIYRLGQKFRLMFDAVINHASIRSAWFQSSLRGE